MVACIMVLCVYVCLGGCACTFVWSQPPPCIWAGPFVPGPIQKVTNVFLGFVFWEFLHLCKCKLYTRTKNTHIRIQSMAFRQKYIKQYCSQHLSFSYLRININKFILTHLCRDVCVAEWVWV